MSGWGDPPSAPPHQQLQSQGIHAGSVGLISTDGCGSKEQNLMGSSTEGLSACNTGCRALHGADIFPAFPYSVACE